MASHRTTPGLTLMLASLLACLLTLPAVAGAKTVLKLGTLAPDGSSPLKVLKAFTKDVAKATNNEVVFKVYPQTKGDELTILKYLKANKLQAAGFTGMGLGKILPEIRVMETPLLFRNYAELDYVMEKMWPYFVEKFDEKGYKLLARAEAGFVNVYSNKPVRSPEDLRGIKLWAWEGDPVSKALAEAYGIVPTYLSLPDVLTALQTNRIDACYAPPFGALQLQWYTKVKYMMDVPLVDAIGAVVVTRKAFDKLAPEHQAILVAKSVKASKLMLRYVRKDNEKSLKKMIASGIEVVPVTAENRKLLEEGAAKAKAKLVGTLYSQALLDRVEGLVAEYRATHK